MQIFFSSLFFATILSLSSAGGHCVCVLFHVIACFRFFFLLLFNIKTLLRFFSCLIRSSLIVFGDVDARTFFGYPKQMCFFLFIVRVFCIGDTVVYCVSLLASSFTSTFTSTIHIYLCSNINAPFQSKSKSKTCSFVQFFSFFSHSMKIDTNTLSQ